jgi:hypothetical protein
MLGRMLGRVLVRILERVLGQVRDECGAMLGQFCGGKGMGRYKKRIVIPAQQGFWCWCGCCGRVLGQVRVNFAGNSMGRYKKRIVIQAQ